MINYKITLILCGLLTTFFFHSFSKPVQYSLISPDRKISLTLDVNNRLTYTVGYGLKSVLLPSELSLDLIDGTSLGYNVHVLSCTRHSSDHKVKPLYGTDSIYRDNYNEMVIVFREKFQVIFRAYDNGVAYRFKTMLPGKIKIKNEVIRYHFNTDIPAWIQKAPSLLFGYEGEYIKRKISSLGQDSLASLPLIAETGQVKIAITEADLVDYPGYYCTYRSGNVLGGVLPGFVLKDSIGGQNNFNRIPTSRADYIADTKGTREFPWRLMSIVSKDQDLLVNHLPYLLSSACKLDDVSWIKPGKVAWDWWNATNLSGVSFKSGFNTDTYKYFIDYAARNHLEYVMMDEGWSDQFDLLKVNDGTVVTDGSAKLSGRLDMPLLFRYAKDKGVGIILWCVWHTLDRQMTEALDQFEKWGVKGIKVDFMDRDDQTVINFYQRLAQEAAKRKMIVDFHAACKPTGMERTYPNILNYEAVQGLEWNKFSTVDILTQATVIPFTRMNAGPMDYTPGGLSNANREDFRQNFFRPMTQGTRCNQLAMFTMYYAPLEMLADAPTAYEKEPGILAYLAGMPNVWDESRPVGGLIGDHAVIARRKGEKWYIAGLNNWTAKKIKVDFRFLGPGKYHATVFSDGVNADRIGNDYSKTEQSIDNSTVLDILMAKGGGFTITLNKENKY